jgi:hypothetical protein
MKQGNFLLQSMPKLGKGSVTQAQKVKTRVESHKLLVLRVIQVYRIFPQTQNVDPRVKKTPPT